MISLTSKQYLLLALTLYPSSLFADSTNCPGQWAITLKGDADYGCFVTSKDNDWTSECGKNKTICAKGIDNNARGGGAIHLFASKDHQGVPGTLIECTFTSEEAQKENNWMSASNCDISNVDGYNFDVNCYGDASFGHNDTDHPTDWSQCTTLDADAGVCKNPQGKSITKVEDAPAFFHNLGYEKGTYVAANQVGVPVSFPNEMSKSGKEGHIICEVNGGYKGGAYGQNSGQQNSKREEIEMVEASPVEARSEHRLKHAHRARRVHARGLDSVVGAGKI